MQYDIKRKVHNLKYIIFNERIINLICIIKILLLFLQ